MNHPETGKLTEKEPSIKKNFWVVRDELKEFLEKDNYSAAIPLIKELSTFKKGEDWAVSILYIYWKDLLHFRPENAENFIDQILFALDKTHIAKFIEPISYYLYQASTGINEERADKRLEAFRLLLKAHKELLSFPYDFTFIKALIIDELIFNKNLRQDDLELIATLLKNYRSRETDQINQSYIDNFLKVISAHNKDQQDEFVLPLLFDKNLMQSMIAHLVNRLASIKPENVLKYLSKNRSVLTELPTSILQSLLFTYRDSELAHLVLATPEIEKSLKIFAQNILDDQKHVNNLNLPTSQHLKNNAWNGLQEQYISYFTEPQLSHLYKEFRRKEEEFNNKGYYTFVHGQENRFYFPERLYTHLWGLRHKQPIDKFFFAHVKDLVATPEAKFEEDIMRKTIHMTGSATESENPKIDILRRKKVLFMNYAFFANSYNLGSSSANYIIRNINSPIGSEVKISSREPFTLLGYDWIYEKHQQEIEQLIRDYETLSRFNDRYLSGYGNMLLIAIPKDKIYKYVYLCESGALQKSLEKKDGTKITDIRIAMETLLKNPETLQDSDRIEFCLIMTQQKGGLDPSTGIQIYPLLSGDPEKLKALQEREKILLDKITADVKEAEKQQALQRAAKITEHVVESAKAK
jgi:hypothetical protein